MCQVQDVAEISHANTMWASNMPVMCGTVILKQLWNWSAYSLPFWWRRLWSDWTGQSMN